MKVTLPRRFAPAVDATECKHGLMVMTCVLCNGRQQVRKFRADPLRLEDLLGDATPAEAALFKITTTKMAVADGVKATAAIDPGPPKCSGCAKKAPNGSRRGYRRDPVRTGSHGKGFTAGGVGDRWVIERKIHDATHRVNGKPLCDECCHNRGGCERCRNTPPERHVPGRRERKSHSGYAVSVESHLFS